MDFQYTYFDKNAVELSLMEGRIRPLYSLASTSIYKKRKNSQILSMNPSKKLPLPLITRKEVMDTKNYEQHISHSPQRNNTLYNRNLHENVVNSQKIIRSSDFNNDLRQVSNHFSSKHNITYIKNVMNSSIPQKRIPSTCKVQGIFGSHMRDYHSIHLKQNTLYSWPNEVKSEPSNELHSNMYGISPPHSMFTIGVPNKKFGCLDTDKFHILRRQHNSYWLSSPNIVSKFNQFHPLTPQRVSFYSYLDEKQQKCKVNEYSQNVEYGLMHHYSQNSININLTNKIYTKNTFKKGKYLKKTYSDNEKRIRRPQKRFSLKISLKPSESRKSRCSTSRSGSEDEMTSNGYQSDMDLLFPRSKDGNIPLTTNVPRKVEALHPTTKKRICVYASCSEASRQMGINRTRMSRTCRSGGGIINHIFYKYIESVLSVETGITPDTKRRKKNQEPQTSPISESSELKHVDPNVMAAASALLLL